MIPDKKISLLTKQEEEKQKKYINLIASENYVSKNVRKALSSCAVNKYSEGYPKKRYYPGNKFIDQMEETAKERALKLFKLSDKEWHVNVQPYSGSPANFAAYLGFLKFLSAKEENSFGKKISFLSAVQKYNFLGMKLDQGGHLTHGHRVSLTGELFNFAHYGVGPDGRLDYNKINEISKKERPSLIICGATAYPREINFEKFGRIAKSSGAYLMADIAHIAGLIAGGQHPSPFPYCDIVTTTTHKTMRGPRGAMIFTKKNICFPCKEKPVGKLYESIDKAVFPGLQGGPHDNQTLAIAVSLGEALSKNFALYQKQIKKNAKVLAEELKKYGFNLLTDGTDNHLILIDLRNKNISGAEAEYWLYETGIIVNRNSIPNDPAPPMKPSGIRIGTPAITTRGAKEKEMKKIAFFINEILLNPNNAKKIKKEVLGMTKKLKNI